MRALSIRPSVRQPHEVIVVFESHGLHMDCYVSRRAPPSDAYLRSLIADCRRKLDLRWAYRGATRRHG